VNLERGLDTELSSILMWAVEGNAHLQEQGRLTSVPT